MADGASVSSQSGHSRAPLDPPSEVRITDRMDTQSVPGRGMMMNQYERGDRIGSGQHGEVFNGVNIETNTYVAIKGIRRKNPKEEKMKMLRKSQMQATPHLPHTDRLSSTENKIKKEIAIMKKCRHPHIVRLLEVIDDRMKSKIYMIMEYLGGGEIKWRNSNGDPILSVDQSRRICRDAILGLEYLHYQGIIHRDIKPANLLWTEDRQMVKISDFGVSHFSVAARTAPAGRGLPTMDFPIGIDDSELSKRAGTPSFLAPEIVHEYVQTGPITDDTEYLSDDNRGSSAKDLGTFTLPTRPPITKAIDVWALGATLYCLLFGHTPFHGAGDNAFRTYLYIANNDWGVEKYMGLDKILTGGRTVRNDDSEGAVVIKILDGMLQKEVSRRSTLHSIKSTKWITRDIPNPSEWLRETDPGKKDVLNATDAETASAMSEVHRPQGWLRRQLSAFLSNVRPHHRPSKDDDHDRDFGTNSAPLIRLPTPKSYDAKASGSVGRKGGKVMHGREKVKRREGDADERVKGRSNDRPQTARNVSAISFASTSTRSKSVDRWPPSKGHPQSSGGTSRRSRQGSDTLIVPGDSDPEASPTSSRNDDDHTYSNRHSTDDRQRHRFFPFNWRSARNSPNPSNHEASTSSLPFSGTSPNEDPRAGPSSKFQSRASDEGLSAMGDRNSPLIFARRASSWTDPAHDADLLSLNSGDEMLDADTIFLGAGGVSNEPPFASIAAIGLGTAAASVAAAALPLPLRQPQPQRLLLNNAVPTMPDPAMQDARQNRIQAASPSPLAHMAYGEVFDGQEDEYDTDNDSLHYGEPITSPQYRAGDYAHNPSIPPHHAFDDDDDGDISEEEEDDDLPIEVRRRRPSVAITAPSPSPPPDSSEE